MTLENTGRFLKILSLSLARTCLRLCLFSESLLLYDSVCLFTFSRCTVTVVVLHGWQRLGPNVPSATLLHYSYGQVQIYFRAVNLSLCRY